MNDPSPLMSLEYLAQYHVDALHNILDDHTLRRSFIEDLLAEALKQAAATPSAHLPVLIRDWILTAIVETGPRAEKSHQQVDELLAAGDDAPGYTLDELGAVMAGRV